ncbi:ATP-binding protein [Paenibacillus sp. sptzw28]|uniref:ATP-binding protein n=1 Tax=Paenibacillus sp. sptzw28 TaxID=715179 RepID=UPI001C6E70E3|nr:ATP-binding protein [Paenibacillus sp. sptzw28]QYR19477.1 ATP-binding protein [Paenibacillus sp. sptzw28]
MSEAIIFIGVQGAGKSTFYKRRFFRTHMRINLDMLKTRRREQIFLQAAFDAKQPFVIDNTNPAADARRGYIALSKKAGFLITGYYFETPLEDALQRNDSRLGKERIPDKAVQITYGKMEIPKYEEGFDELFTVKLMKEDYIIERITKDSI